LIINRGETNLSIQPLDGVIVSDSSTSLMRDLALLEQPRPRDRSPYWVYLVSLPSPRSQRTMAGCLDQITCLVHRITTGPETRQIGQLFPWENVRYAHTQAIRALVASRGWSPSYVNQCLSAFRQALRRAWKLDLMPGDAYEKASEVESARGSREPAGRHIQQDEIAAMRGACLTSPSLRGIRDDALLALLRSGGIRRAEAAGALIARYNADERSLQIIGKGDKERTVWLHPDAVAALERWLTAAGIRSGAIFRAVDKHGNVGAGPLSDVSIGAIIAGRREQAGVRHLTAHDFRRTFADDFLDAGGDLAQLQAVLGHSSATTTVGYDRRPGRRIRDVVDQLQLPSAEAIATGADDG
jgi:site-specific recombinase XerD